MEIATTNHSDHLSEPHPWIVAESAGSDKLLSLLEIREGLVDSVANRYASDTRRDNAKSELSEINSIIIMQKKALGIDTIPPLPPSNKSPDSA